MGEQSIVTLVGALITSLTAIIVAVITTRNKVDRPTATASDSPVIVKSGGQSESSPLEGTSAAPLSMIRYGRIGLIALLYGYGAIGLFTRLTDILGTGQPLEVVRVMPFYLFAPLVPIGFAFAISKLWSAPSADVPGVR